MQTIDIGRIDAPDPRARDWRRLEAVTAACAIATLLLAIVYLARALPELARGSHPAACPPAAADAPRPSLLPDAARGELTLLFARVSR